MAASINGTGTTFYGHALEESDGSYVVTEWVVFIYLPLIPLGSKRVLPVREAKKPWWKQDLGQKFQATRVPLHMPHIYKGYAILGAIILFFRIVG